jgi:putative Holliday junction resolvase
MTQQEPEIPIDSNEAKNLFPVSGRLLALDLGTKKIGVAVSDESQSVTRGLKTIVRTSWKALLKEVVALLEEFDAVGLVIGLPLETDGSESPMSEEARRIARNFRLSLSIPVALHDERATSYAARGIMWQSGKDSETVRLKVDSEAAAIILDDFISFRNQLHLQD